MRWPPGAICTTDQRVAQIKKRIAGEIRDALVFGLYTQVTV